MAANRDRFYNTTNTAAMQEGVHAGRAGDSVVRWDVLAIASSLSEGCYDRLWCALVVVIAGVQARLSACTKLSVQ